MYHRSCLKSVSCQGYTAGAVLCAECVASGSKPVPITSDGETSSTDQNDTGIGSTGMVAASGEADRMEDFRAKISARMREHHIALELAVRLASASEQEPRDHKKASAAAAAFQRCREAKERATPESVAHEFGSG